MQKRMEIGSAKTKQAEETGEKKQMRIVRVRINHREEPLGYRMDSVRVSWKVTESKALDQKWAEIVVAADRGMRQVLFEKKGGNLCSAGEKIELQLNPYTRYYVQVRVTDDLGESAASEPVWFETAKMQESWTAKWITTEDTDRFHPVFFKTFSLHKRVETARLYICGLGLFSAELNGSRIGTEVLAPYYSNYHDEEQYMTYDITDLLNNYEHDAPIGNQLSVSLGNGWYKGRFGLAGQSENFGSRFRLIAELRLRYEDGTVCTIGTDETWEYAGSDTEYSDLYDGESINRLLWKGKENPLKKACLTEAEGRLTERYSLPVMEMEELSVKEVLQTPKGETVLDFGQNFAGYAAFCAKQPKGAKIVLDFGEILQDGSFYNENYRSAKARFIYVSDGREELVKPRFTYFGFRYARVTGWVGELRAEDFTGIAIYSRMEQTGRLTTGHEGVNKLFSNTLWGQKSNSIDLPTDCPQRDERLGWTGDAQIFSGTACYNMDAAAFYDKFIHDLRGEQKKLDGVLPGVIPVFDPDAAIFSSVWGDIAAFLPAVLYEHYGDIQALAEYYPMMKDWVDKITREDKARGQRYLYDFGNQLGDWLALDGRTEQSMKGGTDDYYIGSCYYAASVSKTADAAGALGLAEEEAYYRDLYRKIYAAVIREYFTETGRLSIDTQTGYIVALYFGIYKDKERVVEGLRERLYRDCYKLKGGFVGAPLMCRVMAENGLEEEAFYFLLQEGYPGWMHCINLGATTIWERWNSVLDDGKMSGTMMNSLNHYSFGTIVEYLYRDVAGLKALWPGFKKALITPMVNQKLGHMEMSYDSAYGIYRIEWVIKGDGSVYVKVEVPFGCSASVRLPFSGQEPQEAAAGVHEFSYRPTEDLRCRYTKRTLFKEMLQDEKAMEIIDRVSPLLQHFLGTGDEEFLNESLETLRGMSFLGFSQEMIEALQRELTQIGREEQRWE